MVGKTLGDPSLQVKKRPPPMLFLHTEVEEDEAEEALLPYGLRKHSACAL